MVVKNKKIAVELEQIRKAHRGHLRPKDVVEFARRNKAAALHRCFEWSNTKAAEAWRLHQARNIIRVVVTVIPADAGDNSRRFRAYVSMQDDRDNQRGYRRTADVLGDENLRKVLLAEAYEELRVFRMKYQCLSELNAIFDAIDRIGPTVATG